MKLLYAPDTADHPNWGCRFMGDWYRQALVDLGGVRIRRIGSRWFFHDDPKVPAPLTWPDRCAAFDAARPYVTVSASSAFVGAGQHGGPAEAFVALCRRLAQDVAQVVLVAPCEVDAAIMRKVQAATGFPLLGLNLPVAQGIDVLGNARVHVGGRWHPGIFAATGGTPLVAMGANTHKMSTLMQQLHPDEPVFDALALASQVDAIVARARVQVDAGPELRARVLQQAAVMRARVEGNLGFVQRRLAASADAQAALSSRPT